VIGFLYSVTEIKRIFAFFDTGIDLRACRCGHTGRRPQACSGEPRANVQKISTYVIAKEVTVHPMRLPTCSRVIFAMGMAGRQARLRAFTCAGLNVLVKKK